VDTSNEGANRQIARAAGVVMAAFILSNLTGLARQVVVLNAFGTSGEMDAFNAANRVSETLFNLVAGGALASAFIPTFTALLAKEDRRGAWQLASAIANLILAILSILAALAALFAPQIVRYVLAPGFAGDPAQEALTVDLLRIMLPSAAIFSLSGLAMGILNSNQVFFVPALAPALYQAGMIFGVLALTPRLGIYGLAWGVVIGAGLHLALQVPSLLRQKAEYYPGFGLDSPAVREVGRLMLPRLLGVAVVQLNFWVNIYLASHMAEGSVTGIAVAFALMLMPQAAIAQSIAIAALPTFSVQFARDRLGEMRASLAASLRGVLLLSIPASIGLILLREPVIVLLYQRGEFTARSTGLVAWALLWYASGLVGHALVEVLSRAFYAMHDTRTPVVVGVGAMSLNLAFSLLFSTLFARWGWMPHGGLALANSLATALEMAGLLYLMRGRLRGLEGGRVLAGTGQAAAATLVMALALWVWMNLTAGRPAWLITLGGVAGAAGIYGALLLVLRVAEARELAGAVNRRLWTSLRAVFAKQSSR
jgi:putative peptidoglycan lipid II flippase